MSVIKRIEIRNFRSIYHLILENDILDLNTFVGSNDIGKSNILRALNLFFNSETDLGKRLDFWEDFNKNIERKSGKGQYIKIVLDIDLKYENHKYVRWTKQWDNDGKLKKNEKEVFTNDGQQSGFISNSRAKGWIERIRFRYVPAIKSPEYFKHLFEELHDVLNYTYSEQFRNNTQTLIQNIQTITEDITNELKDSLSIENKISIPSDLKLFFGTLDFSFEYDNKKFHLKNRGDGIKVRHIPIVLKFLADKAKRYKRGALDVQTIWGFEEPENNLEMSQAFEMATNFLKYSNDIQIFVSTHSPAFYSLYNKSSRCSCFLVERDEEDFTTVENVNTINVDLDERMGVLAYITPFVEQKNKELIKQREEKSRLHDELNNLDPKTSILVLTEDSSGELRMLKSLMESIGFSLDTITFISYNGKENLNSAYFASKLLIREKYRSVKYVILHRDRDIDGEEIKKYLDPKFPDNYHLFITRNYDLDSYFINKDHFIELYPELNVLDLDQIINESIDSVEEISKKKICEGLFHKELKFGELTHEHSPTKLLTKASELYENNPSRYYYGKKVMGHIIGKLQQHTRKNRFDPFQKSNALVCEELKEILLSIKSST